MASESIGSVYPTQIPGYADAADIQAALRLYHYGSVTAPANEDELVSSSVAGHLKALDVRLDDVEDIGIGSIVSDDEPQDVPDGYIWVDSNALLSTEYSLPSVIYQDSEPEDNLSSGMLWVDKNSTPLTMYVYDEDLGWRAIGS